MLRIGSNLLARNGGRRNDSLRIAVTGGAGRLGKYVLEELAAHGHKPICIDQREPAPDGCGHKVRLGDLTDLGEVYGLLRGAEAVIHLAAVPSAGIYADDVTFRNNSVSHFNVLEACAGLGIPRVASASTIQVIAQVGAESPVYPDYFPVDEEHPIHPQNAYSLSKQLGEVTNAAFHRRHGIQALSLRFCWVADADEIRRNDPGQGGDAKHFWSYVDFRDAAQCCRLAVEASGLADEAFYVAAADTLRDEPTLKLLQSHFPDKELRDGLDGFNTAVDIRRARRLLGYEPKHSWRT